jgi:hypothetical protein
MIAPISEDLVWSQIVARAWCDEGFLKRLLSGPRGVLAEHDLEVPPGTEVEVVMGPEVKVEDTDAVRRFILPASPSEELMEEELVGAVASCAVCAQCACACACATCRRCAC